ncbi:MAG: DNA-3-methyladenine glycosylase I [Candidatus Kapabacteria bacterium]|nr:DNA-3-methyladenine glycosylase I [Candidatus Kapabacteria bacterium]
MVNKHRCDWCLRNEKMIKYHDTEWGVPLHNDKKLFEFLILDAFQAGLSWSIILNKRENFREAFDDFDYKKVSNYDEIKIDQLLTNSGIIRNKAKIQAAIKNAIAFQKVQEEFGSFDSYIWQFSDGKTIKNQWYSIKELPAKSEISDRMSKDLIKRGFKFVGSTICYAFMQAIGMVNDHLVTCYRYNEL